LGYKKISDSLNVVNRTVQNLYAAMRFDVNQEKLINQRTLVELEKERSEKQFTLLIAALVGLLLLVIILFILYRIRHIKQKEVFITENRISKKVHDEVANEVYQLMVKMQLKHENLEDLLDDLEFIYNRSRDISKEFNTIDNNLPYNDVLLDLLSSYQSDNLRIINRNVSKYNWNALSQNKKNAIYRVLQELLTNMKKHSQATLVVVSVSQQGKKTDIKYTDNGVGTVLKKQNGLQNAENRIFALNGSITFETAPGNGFQVKIVI
jgi:signal transduction histidine kinase